MTKQLRIYLSSNLFKYAPGWKLSSSKISQNLHSSHSEILAILVSTHILSLFSVLVRFHPLTLTTGN